MNKNDYYEAIRKCDLIIKQEEDYFTKKVFRDILGKLYKYKNKDCYEKEVLIKTVLSVYKVYEQTQNNNIETQINILFKEEVL